MAEIKTWGHYKGGPMTITVTLRWWLRAYLSGLVLFCALTGARADVCKVEAWIKRGLRLEVRHG